MKMGMTGIPAEGREYALKSFIECTDIIGRISIAPTQHGMSHANSFLYLERTNQGQMAILKLCPYSNTTKDGIAIDFIETYAPSSKEEPFIMCGTEGCEYAFHIIGNIEEG